MTETDLVRLLLRGYVPPERPGPEFFEDMNRISEFAEQLQTLSTVTSGEEVQELLESEAKAWRTFRLEMERKYLMPKGGKQNGSNENQTDTGQSRKPFVIYRQSGEDQKP